MQVTTFEGVVEDGVIRLPNGVKLPELVRVDVVIPPPERQPVRIMSPRLANPDDRPKFELTIERLTDNAPV